MVKNKEELRELFEKYLDNKKAAGLVLRPIRDIVYELVWECYRKGVIDGFTQSKRVVGEARRAFKDEAEVPAEAKRLENAG